MLTAAYFLAATQEHAAAAKACEQPAADFLLGDCSRVAKQDVMLLHASSNGLYTVLPLKVQPDHGIALSSEGVAEASAGPLLPIAKKSRKTPVNRSGFAAYWEFMSPMSSLLMASCSTCQKQQFALCPTRPVSVPVPASARADCSAEHRTT